MAGNDKVPELTNAEFNDFTKEGLALVDFFAEWCMPCVMMGPIIDELSEKFKGKIKFGKVNVEDNQSLAAKHNVSSIPNMILFKNGKEIERFIGSVSAEDFEVKLKKFL
ncbi:MAG: thioredoxin [Nanoarchaeota archaeon]|nr:thioredoxin [Nanoarchaeota archaeon]MBU1027753.1 thioredoxin [Nanoarchaeota archaeon]